MGYFAGFQTEFWNIAIRFNSFGDIISGIPVLGAYAAYPVYWIALFFANLSDYAQIADVWSNSVGTAISAVAGIPYDIYCFIVQQTQAAYDYALWLFMQLNAALQHYWEVLDQIYLILLARLKNYIDEVTTGIVQYTIELAEYVWSWLTSGTLQSWLTAWLDPTWLWNRIMYYAHFDFLNEWMGEVQSWLILWVEGAIGWLIRTAFDTLGNSWSSFTGAFTWLLDRLIDLMFDQASRFAAPLWTLAEKILEKIELPPG